MGENKYIQYSYLPDMYKIYTPFVHIDSAISICDNALLEIDKKLDAVYDMSGNGYNSQIDNFSTLLGNLQTMWHYLESIPYDLDSLIDEPLNKKFANEATEGISRIKLDNFKTKETTGIKETLISTVNGKTYSAEIDKSEVGFSDFLGSSLGDTKIIAGNEDAISSLKQTDCVKNFANLFKSDYESLVISSGYEGDLDSYLNSLMNAGAFEHKMDKPFLGFVSAVLDVTIIKPIIEACLGYDIITGEDLSESERGMKVFAAVIEVIAIALAIPTDGASIPIWQTIVKVLVSDAAANGAGYLAAEAGLPVWAQIAIAAGVGIGTYKLGNKFFAVVGNTTVPINEEIYAEILNSTGGKSGTVWDDITPTQEAIEGTTIPKSFEISTPNGDFWVNPNGSKHMIEYSTTAEKRIAEYAANGIEYSSKELTEQELLRSLQGAISEAASKGFEYEKIVVIDNWELIFSAPREEGLLPVLKHAVYRP